ncbi:hypothetical protein M3Y99_00987300 [Aphelenchoides fujianensis]|nr:hypothetical protein M3Y99_00987300 [Aphelenchoides fujianensis]
MSVGSVMRGLLFGLVRLISGACSTIAGFFRFGRQSQRIGELPLYHRVPSDDPQASQSFPMHSDPANTQHAAFLQSSSSFDAPHATAAQTADSWGTWAEQEQQQSIESKIAEYRNQMEQQQRLQREQKRRNPVRGGPTAQTAANSAPAAPQQPADADDLFSDLQPTLKAPKMYRVRDPAAESVAQAPRQSLFEVRDDPFANRQFDSSQLGDLDLNPSSSDPTAAASNWDAEEEVAGLDEALNEQKRREIVEKQRQRREEHERRLNQKRGLKSS